MARAPAEIPATKTKAMARRRRRRPGRTWRPGTSSGPFQPVPDAPDRLDERRARRVILDLGPKTLDGRINHPGVAKVVVVPHSLEEQLPGERLPRATGQLHEQAELGRRKPEVLPV